MRWVLATLVAGACTVAPQGDPPAEEPPPVQAPGSLTIATSGEVQAELEPCG